MMTCLGKAVCIELVCTNLSKHYYKLLGTYEELQKAAVCQSLHRSVVLVSCWTNFLKFYFGGVSLSCVKKIQVWLKLGKGNMYCMYAYACCGRGGYHAYLCYHGASQ